MKTSESVSEHISRTMAIANKRQINGEKLEDVTIVEKILLSLTTNFNYVVCVIEESKDIDILSIDELQSSKAPCLSMSRKLSNRIRKNKPYKLHHIPKVQALAKVNGRTKMHTTNQKMILLLIQEGNGKALTATTQMAKNRCLQTSQKWNVFDVTDMAIISLSVELIWISDVDKDIILQRKKKKFNFWWCVMRIKAPTNTCGI